MSTTTGISPAETVERALAAARSDDCVVIAEETSAANLRWAGNTLTTNGVSRSRQLTVIAVDRRGDGAAAGVVSRAAFGPTRSKAWSARRSTRPPRPLRRGRGRAHRGGPAGLVRGKRKRAR